MAIVPWKYCNPYAERKKEHEFSATFCGHHLKVSQRTGTEISVEKNTGNIVWDGAYLLAKYIETAIPDQNIRGKRVIELGCGTALVGLVAYLRGGDVTVTDIEDVVTLAQENITKNTVKTEKDECIQGTIKSMPLLWGSQSDIAAVGAPFDIIIGSEIVYHRDMVNSLLKTLDSLSHGNTVIYLSYKKRGLGEDIFFKKLPRYGFDMDEITQGIDPEFVNGPVKLLRLYRSEKP